MNINEAHNLITALHNAKGIIETISKQQAVVFAPDQLAVVVEQLAQAQADIKQLSAVEKAEREIAYQAC